VLKKAVLEFAVGCPVPSALAVGGQRALEAVLTIIAPTRCG